MRSLRTRIGTSGVEGINEQVDLCTQNQLVDCRNVWAQAGSVEARPGYVGVSSLGFLNNSSVAAGPGYLRAEDTSTSTFTSPTANVLALDGLVARTSTDGDRWYLGHDAPFSCSKVAFNSSRSNSSGSTAKAEYWNGTDWIHIEVNQVAYANVSTQNSLIEKVDHLGIPTRSPLSYILFHLMAKPKDWAASTIDGQLAYWMRFSIQETDLDGEVEIKDSTWDFQIDGASYTDTMGMFAYQRTDGKGYCFLRNAAHVNGDYLIVADVNSLQFDLGTRLLYQASDATDYVKQEPATMAVLPQFNETYIAHYNTVTRIANKYDYTASTKEYFRGPLPAEVEDDLAFVGSGAPYDKDSIAQLSVWPKGKYISFFAGHIWAAGIEGEPYTIRWSAPVPYHRIWPELNFEYLMEDDNSPITAIYPLGEHMVVFKQDSIWIMVDSGTNAFGLQSYVPKKMVSGVGCVASSSIQSVRGNLVFLAEDGLYAFNGRTAEKVTLDRRSKDPSQWADRLETTINSITKTRRKFCSSAHWKTKRCYLLSFTTDGTAKNNLTVCWNYDKDTFWLWDDLDAQIWMSDEDGNDQEVLYFVDYNSDIFKFGYGKTNHGGAMSSYIVSRHFGINEPQRKRILDNILWCHNGMTTATVEVLVNDGSSGTSLSMDFSDTTNEAQYGSATYSTDSYVDRKRRRKRGERKEECDWFQLKVSHSVWNERFKMDQVTAGVKTFGIR